MKTWLPLIVSLLFSCADRKEETISANKGAEPTSPKSAKSGAPPAQSTSIELSPSAGMQAISNLLCKGNLPVRLEVPPTDRDLALALPVSAPGFRVAKTGIEFVDGEPEAAYVVFEDDELGVARTLQVKLIGQGPWQKQKRLAPGVVQLVDPAWKLGFVPSPCSMTPKGDIALFRAYQLDIDGNIEDAGEARFQIGGGLQIEMVLIGAKNHQEIVDLVSVIDPERLKVFLSKGKSK